MYNYTALFSMLCWSSCWLQIETRNPSIRYGSQPLAVITPLTICLDCWCKCPTSKWPIRCLAILGTHRNVKCLRDSWTANQIYIYVLHSSIIPRTLSFSKRHLNAIFRLDNQLNNGNDRKITSYKAYECTRDNTPALLVAACQSPNCATTCA